MEKTKAVTEAAEEHQDLPRNARVEEIQTLVHDRDSIPITAWLLTFTGAAAHFARFGVAVVWQNYLQNPRGDPSVPGALGVGQATATTIQNALLFVQYLTPIPFALMSDMWIGRYKTMIISLAFLVFGLIILLLTSLPFALDAGAGVGGFVVAAVLIGCGTGGLSAVMYPFIADQIPDEAPRVKCNKRGELVVTDRKISIQYIFNGYYWMVNIAALSCIPTTLMEKHIGFWAAYLLPMSVLAVGLIPIIIWNNRLVKLPPEGNALPQAGEVLLIAIRSRFQLSVAEPEHQRQYHQRDVPWSSHFVEEIRRGIKACRVIICFVVFYLCYNQTTNNIISQAGQMLPQGLSNDTIQALNPIACIILGPLIQDLLFPYLRRRRIALGPIMRMTVAFLFVAGAIAYAAGLQHLVYSRGPCFEYPLECHAAVEEGTSQVRPNEVSVWLQAPLHFLLAVGEILALVALNEYTYTEAPTDIKSMVQALEEMAAAVGAALGVALGPVSKNPWLVIMYGCLAGSMAISSVAFWAVFRKSDAAYEDTDAMVDNAADDMSKGRQDQVAQKQ